MKKIPYGISDYKQLIEGCYYYVDKTMYLSKLEDATRIALYLRPRRFGKTLFTSMMYYYYDINSKSLFDSLYKDTYIYNNPTSGKNNYYVLKFDFSGMSSNNNDVKVIEEKFKTKVIADIKIFLDYYGLFYEIDTGSSAADIILNFFVYFRGLNLEKKLYIIIDEYDNFTNSILSKDVDLFKSILGDDGFVKDFYARIKEYSGTVVDRVFITGVCSISVDSMTSGFNIATNITTDPRFNSMTALTHNEIKELIREYDDRDKIFNEMLENYDGYNFNRMSVEFVFNPTLTMYYLNHYNDFNIPPMDLLDSNIISNYNQIEGIISLGDYESVVKDIFDDGVAESNLITDFNMNRNMDFKFTNSHIISLLFYFGYLTIKGESPVGMKFIIPNSVIRELFSGYFYDVLERKNVIIDNEKTKKGIIEMAYKGIIKTITEVVSSVVDQESFRDFIGMDEHSIKQIYLSLLYGNNAFYIISEMEVQKGYVDIFFKRKNDISKYNILIELKYLSKYRSSDYEKEYNKALEQINKYIIDNRLPKTNLKKYIVIFIGSDYKITSV